MKFATIITMTGSESEQEKNEDERDRAKDDN